MNTAVSPMKAKTKAFWVGPRPKRTSLKTAKLFCIPAKAKFSSSTPASSGRMLVLPTTARSRLTGFILRKGMLMRRSTGSDSGRRKNPKITLPKVSAAATKAGAERLIVLSSPPIAGPSIKPKPKAAPIRPKPLARSSGGVTSAIYAWAVLIFPPVMPSRIRAKNSTASTVPMPRGSSWSARPNTTYEIPVPARLISSTGRRPNRSDSAPSTGEKINWNSEKLAARAPTSRARLLESQDASACSMIFR